jgi:hypothetical protein
MQENALPETFRPLLWSYDFARIDPLKHKKTIIVQALNYGTLAHWRWLVQSYGRELREVLTHVPASEIKPRSLRLASLAGVPCRIRPARLAIGYGTAEANIFDSQVFFGSVA